MPGRQRNTRFRKTIAAHISLQNTNFFTLTQVFESGSTTRYSIEI